MFITRHHKEIKRQLTNLEKRNASHTTGKKILSGIYKELLQINKEKYKLFIKKWSNNMNRYLTREKL